MTDLQRIELRRSELRSQLAKLTGQAEQSDESRAEIERITREYQGTETEFRAATLLADSQPEGIEEAAPDAEQRERQELRSKARVTGYLQAALTGKQVTGAEAELAQAAGVDGIPMELFEKPQPVEKRAITPAPSTVGVMMDAVVPQVFSPSLASALMVEMPAVGSGTYAIPRISTGLTADAVAKGGDAPNTAGALGVQTTTPHRVAGALELAIEDIAAVGIPNFEAALRENLSLVLSDELDDQLLNGDGTGANLSGFFKALPDATEATNIATWALFLESYTALIDGKWATTESDVRMLVGPATYRLAAKTFRANETETTFSTFARSQLGGMLTNSRMPAASSNVQAGIAVRSGMGVEPMAMRRAVCPHWGYISIDDIYGDLALKGQRRFVVSALVGDLLIVQPDAYSEVSFKVA